jgi:hypothetical protein
MERAMEFNVRRLVTGHDAKGRSVFVEDSSVPMKGFLHELWLTKETPAKTTGAPHLGPYPVDLEPPKNGSIIRFVQFEPTQAVTREELEKRYAQVFASINASHARVDTRRHPAMHKTASLDYGIVLSGEITLLLDEGERTLKPFSVCVQRGTNHGWVNNGTEPALMAFILLSGEE